jgi:zinc D-Ala-D-Ala dipeptidase
MLTRTVSTLLAVWLCASCASKFESASALPDGFVRLSEMAPSIRQDMRYATATNFMGRRILGYESRTCILTIPTALALQRARESLVPRGLTLVVFDCYRPARAVGDFMQWTATPGPADPVWRPNVSKDQLVPQGYIAARSGHSRGSTVDIGIARIAPNSADRARRRSPCARMDPNTLDFGTPFDCFDPVSNTASGQISLEARANRDLLVNTMTAAGFRNYPAEWWHFTLVDEPFPNQIFDFPVSKAPAP